MGGLTVCVDGLEDLPQRHFTQLFALRHILTRRHCKELAPLEAATAVGVVGLEALHKLANLRTLLEHLQHARDHAQNLPLEK